MRRLIAKSLIRHFDESKLVLSGLNGLDALRILDAASARYPLFGAEMRFKHEHGDWGLVGKEDAKEND